MKNNRLNVGLFGFGCVGEGLHEVANQSDGIKADLQKVCIKNPEKKRSISSKYFTIDPNDILKREDLDVIVELINDSEEAFEIVSAALSKRQDVVSANKKMIAEHFTKLYDLHIKNGGAFLYEGAVGGSIPVIRNLEEYYDNELLSKVRGIVNGSCNYILTKLGESDSDYNAVVKEAQDAGFAELDPWLDVAGFDSKYKLTILAIHAFGLVLDPKSVLNVGIQNISEFDIQYAKEKGLKIKLIATASRTEKGYRLYVLPTFIGKDSLFFDINRENNAVEIEGAFSDKQFLVGKGAGSHPTGSAVLSDVSALTYKYRYGYRKLKKRLLQGQKDGSVFLEKEFSLKLYVRYCNHAALKKIEIEKIYEKFESVNENYVIADVKFSSLFNLTNDDSKEIFVAELN